MLWFAEILGEKLQALRLRNVTADPGVDRERHLLYSIINAVTDPILLTDDAGKLIIGNLRAEQLFAIRPEESEGRRRAVEINNLFFSSALAGRLVQETHAVRARGGAGRSRRRLRPDVRAADLADGRSNATRSAVVSVLRNVTDLGRARQELEEQLPAADGSGGVRCARSATGSNLLVDSVGDPIIVTDPAGDILMTNAPAERFFTAVRGRRARRPRRGVQANVAQFSSFVSGLLLQSGGSGVHRRWRERLMVTEPDTGRAVPMEAVAGTMMSGPSELTGVVTVLHDQTETIERERLYAELQQASAQLEVRVREATAELAHQNELLRRQALALEQASAAKSQFLANVSHEFRTPLNAILGYSLMLMGGFYGQLTEEQSRTVQRIDANSKHLATLINDVLDIERIEAGRMPLQISQFPVDEVVARGDRGTAGRHRPEHGPGARDTRAATCRRFTQRPAEGQADSRQSAQQRLEVHQGAATSRSSPSSRPAKQRIHAERPRQRGRHCRRRSHPHLRAVPAGQACHHPAAGRHRPGPGDFAPAGADARRRHQRATASWAPGRRSRSTIPVRARARASHARPAAERRRRTA